MATGFRTNIVRTLISDTMRLEKASSSLRSLLDALVQDNTWVNPPKSEAEFDDLERVISACLAKARLKHGNDYPKNFKPREARKAESKLLERTGEDLKLSMRWKDHVSAADTQHGPVVVVEPYGLRPEDFTELLQLAKAGWTVCVDDRFATYFPGSAVCVLLKPPAKSYAS